MTAAVTNLCRSIRATAPSGCLEKDLSGNARGDGALFELGQVIEALARLSEGVEFAT